MYDHISHCISLNAPGFWFKYCSLYRKRLFTLSIGLFHFWLLGDGSGGKCRSPAPCVKFSPFPIRPSILFSFEKLVFHAEEHHRSSSKITPNYFLQRTFGQFRVQLLTDASYKGNVIILWYLLPCIHMSLWQWNAMNWLFILKFKTKQNKMEC